MVNVAGTVTFIWSLAGRSALKPVIVAFPDPSTVILKRPDAVGVACANALVLPNKRAATTIKFLIFIVFKIFSLKIFFD